jgi:transcription initiation factor TFIID subunit 1
LNLRCVFSFLFTHAANSHESRQDDDSLLSESLSSIMVSSKAQGRDAQQSEKSEAASAQNKSAIEKALERFRHYNISNDDAYARSSMRERDRLSINESSNHIGVLPDIRHAAPALRLETTPPAATVEGLNNFHRPRAALYPPKMPAKPLPPATMDTDGEHDDDVEASNHIVLYVRSLSSGTDEVIANVRPTEPIESLRSHAPRFFEHLKQDPKLYFLLHMSSDGKSRFRQGRVSDMKSTFKQEKIISGAVIYVVPFDVQVIPKAKANAVPKPDKPRVPPAAFSQVDNLSVLDGHIYLAEYFEEHPLHVQKSGMGAKRALFYKKENSEDSRGKELAKNTPLQLHEFDLGDRASPFLSPLHPGQYQETLETTLFRAPVYRNEMRTTDFLLVRRSNARYVIREATAAFAVGCMEPHEEVPSPAQANVEEYYSRRMKVYTHRLVRDQQAANPGSPPSVRAADVLKLFPEDNERPIFRSILNSFTENESTGIHEGNEQELRTLKQGVTASEKELREWLTPERVCCMESMQAGVEMLRRAHVNSAELHSVSPQQVLNTTSQLSQDERLTNACCSVETELLRSPWAQTSEFLRSVEGRVALELSTSMRAAQRTGRLFNYIRKLQRSREEQEKPSETKGAQAGHITGTAADLRKLSMEDAADYMRWLGCSEELIKASKRWDRIDIIRRMSKEAERKEKMRSLDLGRFVRSIKTPFRKQREEQSRNASKLFKRQSCLLAHKSSISSVGKEEDTEGESDSDSGYESIERKRQEALQAQPAKQTELTEEDDEEKAALELRKNLNQSRSGKKIKRLKMTVRRTQQNSAQKKQSSNSDESRADIVLTVDKEVKDAYADALALGDEVAKQKALDVVNARRDMDGEETRLPGVQPMAYAGHVNISQHKVVLKAGNQLMHEVVGERQAGQSTDDDVANRPNKAPRH